VASCVDKEREAAWELSKDYPDPPAMVAVDVGGGLGPPLGSSLPRSTRGNREQHQLACELQLTPEQHGD